MTNSIMKGVFPKPKTDRLSRVQSPVLWSNNGVGQKGKGKGKKKQDLLSLVWLLTKQSTHWCYD